MTSKGDKQLIKYISAIQNDFLGRYLAKSQKTSTKDGIENGEREYFDREELGF